MSKLDVTLLQVTQVRTPDELQGIYKELLKIKTMVQQQQESASVPGKFTEPTKYPSARSSTNVQGTLQATKQILQ